MSILTMETDGCSVGPRTPDRIIRLGTTHSHAVPSCRRAGRLRPPVGFCYRLEAGASNPPYGRCFSIANSPKPCAEIGVCRMGRRGRRPLRRHHPKQNVGRVFFNCECGSAKRTRRRSGASFGFSLHSDHSCRPRKRAAPRDTALRTGGRLRWWNNNRRRSGR